jgi:hypothetical protein
MCGRSSIQLQKIFFLRSIVKACRRGALWRWRCSRSVPWPTCLWSWGWSASATWRPASRPSALRTPRMSSRVAVASKPCSWRFSMALMPSRREGHAWEERGRLPLLQPGRTRTSLHDDRLGQRLEARCAAPLNRVWGLSPSTPWRSMPSRPHGSIRRRRRSPCMEPMQRQPAQAQGLSRLGLLLGTAKMAMRSASRCSCVSA